MGVRVALSSSSSLVVTAVLVSLSWLVVYYQWWSISRYVVHLVTYHIHHPK